MGKPLRRNDGTLVEAHAFAVVQQEPMPAPQPQHWRLTKSTPDAKGARKSASTLSDTEGYGRAWSETDTEIPNQRTSGRAYVLNTDRELQLGPPPGRISRQNDDRVSALIGPDIQNTLPVDANWAYIPHQPTSRLLHGATPALRTIADDARIPSTFVGNPLG